MPQNTLHGDIVSGQVIDAGPAKIQVLNKAYKANSDFVNNSSVAYMVSLNGPMWCSWGTLPGLEARCSWRTTTCVH